MTRLILPALCAALLALPAAAQQADPSPPPPPPAAPEAQAAPGTTTPETAPMPILPAQKSGCGRAKQMNS